MSLPLSSVTSRKKNDIIRAGKGWSGVQETNNCLCGSGKITKPYHTECLNKIWNIGLLQHANCHPLETVMLSYQAGLVHLKRHLGNGFGVELTKGRVGRFTKFHKSSSSVNKPLWNISLYSIQFDTEHFIKSQHVRCLVPNQNNTSQWDTIKHVIWLAHAPLRHTYTYFIEARQAINRFYQTMGSMSYNC